MQTRDLPISMETLQADGPAESTFWETEPDENGFISLDELQWCGTFSGHSWRTVFIPHVVPHTVGVLEVIVTWEGGDLLEGYRIDNGTITKHKLEYVLGDAVEIEA